MRREIPGVFLAFMAGQTLFAQAAVAADPLNPLPPTQIFGLSFNHGTVIYSFVVALLIFLACWLWGRGISKDKPRKGQVVLELIVTTFDTLTRDGFGTRRRGRVFLPLLATLFLFIWVSNMMGLIPLPAMHIGGESFVDFNNNDVYDPGEAFVDANGNGVHDPGFFLPAPIEPTQNVSTTLGLALLFVLLIGHGSSIYYNGITGYLKDYFSPGGFIGLVMCPLNVVGKVAEIVSISFRLFGNMFGSAVIISVVSGLIGYLVLPPFMYGFFGVFVGTVQAFVFTMLALTYISSGSAENPEAELPENEDRKAA